MDHHKLTVDPTSARAAGTGLRPGETGPWALRFVALDVRPQVQIGSLLKLTSGFASSHWVVGGPGSCDALVIGVQSEEGRSACAANRNSTLALPALLVGTPEQARLCASREPGATLLLSPPFRHLSLFYCLDVLARQCAALHEASVQPRRLRTLVVDDSPTVRTQLSNVITRLGMLCDIADGAAMALAKLEQAHYDLIIVDVVMPDMDGYKLTREIKRGRGHKNTPVIILTSQASPFDRARGALAGCDTYLTKPVSQKAFFDAATGALRKSMAVQDLSPWLTEPSWPKPISPDRSSPMGGTLASMAKLQGR